MNDLEVPYLIEVFLGFPWKSILVGASTTICGGLILFSIKKTKSEKMELKECSNFSCKVETRNRSNGIPLCSSCLNEFKKDEINFSKVVGKQRKLRKI